MSKITGKEIAIAGVSAAFAVVCVVLSVFVSVATLAFLALSSVALMMPLFVDSGRGCVGAYVAAAAISVLSVGYISAMPFCLMFGLYPIVFYYLRKALKKQIFCLPIKVIFAEGAFTATFFATGLTLKDFPIFGSMSTGAKVTLLAVGLAFVFAVFDVCYLRLYDELKARLAPTLGRFGRH